MKGTKAEFKHLWTVDAHGSSVYALAFSPDGSILVSGYAIAILINIILTALSCYCVLTGAETLQLCFGMW